MFGAQNSVVFWHKLISSTVYHQYFPSRRIFREAEKAHPHTFLCTLAQPKAAQKGMVAINPTTGQLYRGVWLIILSDDLSLSAVSPRLLAELLL